MIMRSQSVPNQIYYLKLIIRILFSKIKRYERLEFLLVLHAVKHKEKFLRPGCQWLGAGGGGGGR